MIVSLQQDSLGTMPELDLLPINKKYTDFAQSNRHFMKLVSKLRKESQYIDSTQLKKKISSIYNQLSDLSWSQVEQWKDIHMIKIRQLSSFFKQNTQNSISFSNQSKLTEYAISLSLDMQADETQQSTDIVEYNSEQIAEVIQQFYFKAYKEDILQTMEEAGYNTSRFRVLYYEESSIFSVFCCWGPNGT